MHVYVLMIGGHLVGVYETSEDAERALHNQGYGSRATITRAFVGGEVQPGGWQRVYHHNDNGPVDANEPEGWIVEPQQQSPLAMVRVASTNDLVF